MITWISILLILAGLIFLIAGTVGLLRFPDVMTRLHALTKADNLGLGLLIAGLALQSSSPLTILRLAVIWLLVIVVSSTCGYLVAQAATRGSAPKGEGP